MRKILYLTDLYYEAKGRQYHKEDLYITSKLKEHFVLVLCHPLNSKSFEKDVELIIFRNTGSVINYKKEYESFLKRVKTNHPKVFNDFKGKADVCGKQYLIDLTLEKYLVIPTIDNINNLKLLPDVEKYMVKPKNGADSIGLKVLSKKELCNIDFSKERSIIQPFIDFEYEVSFYFLNNKLEYALYAPDKNKRWNLKKYEYSKEDLDFSKKFIKWNTTEYGIQRVDACRTKDGKLLLIELEDLNPYLSILEVDDVTRNNFIKDFIEVISKLW